MELEKYIQQRLWKKLPDFTGMHFYNTLPNKTAKKPYAKLDEISCKQVLIMPSMFSLRAALSVVSSKKSNVEVIDKFYEVKKAILEKDFFDLADKQIELSLSEPTFKQHADGLWQANFKLNLKIITNLGESIC